MEYLLRVHQGTVLGTHPATCLPPVAAQWFAFSESRQFLYRSLQFAGAMIFDTVAIVHGSIAPCPT